MLSCVFFPFSFTKSWYIAHKYKVHASLKTEIQLNLMLGLSLQNLKLYLEELLEELFIEV